MITLKYLIKDETPTIAMLHLAANIVFKDNIYENLLNSFNKVKCIQVLTKTDVNIVKKYCKNIDVIFIPNVVETAKISKNYNICNYKIISVGRITEKQKRHYLLLEIYNKIYNPFNKWTINIVGGTGSSADLDYKNKMISYINRNNLKGKILFTGPVKNVNERLINADIFAFPSAFEGMPLALTEAMAAGLPVIGYKSCPSVNELIIDGYNGFLCEDGIDDFAKKLKLLMNNPEMRKRMGENARESMKKFAPQKIWDQWEILINTIGSKK